MANKKIWFIDENENQSRTYTRKLRRLLPDSITVERLFPPYRQMQEYVALIRDPETVCIFVDQKLKDTAIANYTGIELAQYLRAIDAKLPIYILTNYEDLRDEYAVGEWSVEDVIPKEVFNNKSELLIFKARLLRRLDVYEDLLMNRSQRFNQLLRKRLSEGLSDVEETEFQELQFERFAAIEASEGSQKLELEKVVDTNRELINMLHKIKSDRSTKNG
ncbi:MAG: hypothetical protein U0350_20760 [Caldilineaceae bacterium]